MGGGGRSGGGYRRPHGAALAARAEPSVADDAGHVAAERGDVLAVSDGGVAERVKHSTDVTPVRGEPRRPAPLGTDRLCVRCGCISRVLAFQGCGQCGASPFALRPLPRPGERVSSGGTAA